MVVNDSTEGKGPGAWAAAHQVDLSPSAYAHVCMPTAIRIATRISHN
jgi:hypothetical protein